MMELEKEQRMGVELTKQTLEAIEEDNVKRDYPISRAEAYGQTERMGYELDSETLKAIENTPDRAYDEDRIAGVYGEKKEAAI